jgi:3-phosphoglycerate kinase
MGAGEAVFLENIRMLDFELETRDPHVEERIANTFDYIVHDGFGVAHRSGQFSVDGILSCVETDRKALGPASATEWSNLFRFVESASAGSMAVVIGGDVDKFDTKLWLLQDLLKSGKVGLVYLGGVFGTTYLHSVGEGMGKTPISRNHGHQQILARLPEQYPNVLFKLPRCYVGLGPDKAARAWNVETNEHTRRPSLTVEPDSLALDQEPEDFITLLERHHMTSVLAVGPLGYYSHPAFKQGTLQSYQNLATWALRGDSRQLLVGGGNSIDALLELSCFSHPSSDAIMISAGGGALLDAVAEVLRATETNTPVHTSVVRALREAPRSRSSLYNMLGSAENITI